MKRTRYDTEYDRVREAAGLTRPQYDFPDEEAEERDRAARQARIDAGMVEMRERMAKNEAVETEAQRRAAAEMDANRVRWNERIKRQEFERLGLTPPEPLVSLALMISLGWRVEKVTGPEGVERMELLHPVQRRRKTREDYDRERNGEQGS